MNKLLNPAMGTGDPAAAPPPGAMGNALMGYIAPPSEPPPLSLQPAAPAINPMQIATAMHGLGTVRDVIGGLLQKGEKVTHKDATSAILDAVQDGHISPVDAHRELGSMPRDAKKIPDWLSDQYVGATTIHALIHQHAMRNGLNIPSRSAPLRGDA